MPFYFYDLETTGINPRNSRIVQFGGIRTDDDFKIEDEWETLIRLSEDILPEPDAVLVTGITPQQTLQDGISELEFLREFSRRVLKPRTTIVGFNNIRFDDEFMRFTLWRNLFDAYEWQWKDQRSRWDLLDVMRMMRALRPDGINWPTVAGKATNRLELLTKENNISHGAHDALADAKATLELALLVKKAQPKLFEFLLKTRTKAAVVDLLQPKDPKPFVYTSGQYPSENHKTTAAIVLGPHPSNSNALLVFDLRHSPRELRGWTAKQIADRAFMSYRARKEQELENFPVKALHINKAPAVAPLGVLDEAAQNRIHLDVATIQKHMNELAAMPELVSAIMEAWGSHSYEMKSSTDPEAALYDGFISDTDRNALKSYRQKEPAELADTEDPFSDVRLNQLLARYVARNAPEVLDDEKRKQWELYREERLLRGVAGGINLEKYFQRLQELAARAQLSPQQQYLLEELQLYGQSLAPELDAE